MSNDEEHAPSAAASDDDDDEAGADSDREQPARSRKRSKKSLTKVEDEYAVSQRRQALSAEANKGKFAGLRAEKPARANAAPTTKNSGNAEINFCDVKVVGFLCINCQLKNFPQRRRQLFFLHYPPRPPKPVRLTLQ